MSFILKRVFAAGLALIICRLLAGCSLASESPGLYQRYEAEFIGTFDVSIKISGYAKTEAEFQTAGTAVYEKMKRLHQLYDIYHEYEGLSNLKTVNDLAGMEAVKVEPEIIDLLLFSKTAYQNTGGLVNIAMGAPLQVWHEYRTRGTAFPEEAALPPLPLLQEAAEHTNIEDVIIDEEAGTVYLSDPLMSLDVGAVAKGYSAELAKQAAVEAGLESAVINAGGNVLTIGEPFERKRDRWGIGIQDPKKSGSGQAGILDMVYLNGQAVVSSGSYQRYYEVDGEAFHHIIDPDSLMPAGRYAAVSVIHEDSGTADYLSTALFIASYEEGAALAADQGAEVLWVFLDGRMETTEGYRRVSKLFSQPHLYPQ